MNQSRLWREPDPLLRLFVYPLRVRRLTSLLLLLSSSSVFGQAPAPDAGAQRPHPEDAQAARDARGHFQEGMTHYAARHFRRAIEDFTLAARLVPSADLWFNIARSHEELQEHDRAVEYYERYLRDRVDPPDRDAVQTRIEALRERAEAARIARRNLPTTGTLRISANRDEALVQVDAAAVGATPLSEPLELSPGRHSLTLEAPGYIPFRSSVRVEAGVATGAYADLTPMTEYRSIRGRRIVTWIAAGLAVGGLATSLGFGIRARGLRDDALATPAGPMQDGLRDDARARARYSDIATGATLGLVLTAVILYFIEGRAVGTERTTALAGDP